jgi:hypothetical protein
MAEVCKGPFFRLSKNMLPRFSRLSPATASIILVIIVTARLLSRSSASVGT